VIRPLREADLDELFEMTCEVWEEYERVRDRPPPPRPLPERALRRIRRCMSADPDGAWVAEQDGRLTGCGLAIVREGVWGLSLLVVHPSVQSAGVGRELLNACHAYADGARGRIILSSADSRAIRSYARLGLDADPSLTAKGTPRIDAPAGVREGSSADLAHTEAVDRFVRTAAHGADLQAMLDNDNRLLVSERGYAVYFEHELRLLAAYDEAAASDLLRACLARMQEATVEWLTARQQWAIRVCVEARLELLTSQGAVFTAGEVGPFRPYLPSGAYL
jgi:GNAT superfamily N-acetyltransferase